jgi:hypothetical protein
MKWGAGVGQAAAGRDDAAVAHVVEQFAALLETYGFPRMSGRIIMALMVTESPGLTAAELAETLQVSPAAISTSMRYPLAVGLVEKIAVQGHRRARYRLPDDAWYAASATKDPLYRRIADLAAEGVGAVGGVGTEPGARLEQMRDFFSYLEAEVPALVERWHDQRVRDTR